MGVIEYFRLSEEYREKVYNDFPYHEKIFLEISIVIVCLVFGPTLLVMKLYYNIKQFLKNFWIKITFPYRIYKFKKKMKQVNDEKDPQKSVKLLFEAMGEIFK